MTTRQELKKQVNHLYCDVFIKRRFSNGTYESEWLDISSQVLRNGLDRIVYKLDSDDYDVGVFTLSNVRMVFDNGQGRFNDIEDSRSFWTSFETRHLTKVKIEYGYLDDNFEKIVEVAFQGLWDDKSFDISDSDQATVVVLSRESAFKTVSVVPGTISSSMTAAEAIYSLCSRGEVSQHMNVSLDNINPANNIIIDTPSVFDTDKLDGVLNDIMLITNSVLYIDRNDNLIVRGRDTVDSIKYDFYLNSETGKHDNIYSIADYNSGRHRVKNAWYWSDTSVSATSIERHLEKYGVTKKVVSSTAITNDVTRQSVIDMLLEEWQFPKKELILETDYLANEVSLLDIVRLDVRPTLSLLAEPPICGFAVCGEAICADYASGLKIDNTIGFKIISIEHDLRNAKTTLKLREKGKTLTDGYFEMVLSKTYTVAFTAESTKDVNVSADGINAQRAIVQVLDESDDYANVDITVQRPTSNIVRLIAGGAITQNFRVLVVEVSE